MSAALRAAFLDQAINCEMLDSPFMGRLLRLLAERWPDGTALAAKCAAWEGDIGPSAASLPLRIAGGLHALVLQDMDPGLVAAYPPNDADDETLWAAVSAALHCHDAFLVDWIDSPPQTNEVRRAAVLIGAAQLLSDRFGKPLQLTELGASGGLNLVFDRFRLDLGGTAFGPDLGVTLSPRWTGVMPPSAPLVVRDRRGVDLNPLATTDRAGQLRLLAYLWPDQAERMDRTRAAIALQQAPVDRADAIDWLQARLAPVPGTVHLVYHTVAWQYFPEEAKARGEELLTGAGLAATADTPLAWLGFEADGSSPGAGIRLRLWPGDHDLALGRADFHGRWVDWTAPERLP